MVSYRRELEEYCFSSTDELKTFLKEEWLYDEKGIDTLLEERYEEDQFTGKSESSTSKVELTPDNSGGFTQWYLAVETVTNKYSN
tara:strand:- start:699 stop:953 length:255 start_codon:yes stop_codon:yes gene_type:complete